MRCFVLIMLAIISSQFVSVQTAIGDSVSDPSIYPLSMCAVCGEAFDAESAPVISKDDGREIRYCVKKCKETFKQNPSLYLKKLNQSIIDDQLPFYPVSTCLVSGKVFGGDMGEPADYLFKNRLVRFCCKNCLSSFNKKPDDYIAKLDEAVIAAQLEDYPAETCPVAGEKLGGMGEPYNYVFAGRLIRFCCGGCIGGFKSNPTAALAAVYGDGIVTE